MYVKMKHHRYNYYQYHPGPCPLAASKPNHSSQPNLVDVVLLKHFSIVRKFCSVLPSLIRASVKLHRYPLLAT